MLTRFSLCLIALCTPATAQVFEPGDVVESPLTLVAFALENFEYFGEGNPTATITVAPNEANNLVVTLEEDGFLDDSVAALRLGYTLTNAPDGGWEVLTMTREQRCHRGDPDAWITGPCP